MNSGMNQTQDIPASVALIGLVLVLGVLFYLNSPASVAYWQSQVGSYIDSHSDFLMSILVSFSLNAIAFAAFFDKAFGLNQQGKRLALLTKERQGRGGLGSSEWKKIGIASAIGVLTFFLLRGAHLPGIYQFDPLPVGRGIKELLLFLIQVSFSVSAWIVAFIGMRMFGWQGFQLKLLRRLPQFPKPKNGIVLGSIYDETPTEKPEWCVIHRRALNGNLLITGSIGGGKTQGSVLTYLDQILENFDPKPSILAIDPKGTFIPEALKMIKKRGLEEHVLHLKLGGSVTFNPIGCEKPLKNAQFLNIAQMIRAASINFMGKGSDSPFWEISAFNLMKNTLALCAAKRMETGYTLQDLYSEMILAASDPMTTAHTFTSLLKDSRFDDEEKFNIACAADYFKEFRQMEEKLRTGILATATAFLNQFQEFQANRIFCPKGGRGSIRSMDEVVDQGKILLFDIDSPGLARSMGTFIKLHYQQSVLNRLTATQRSKDHAAVIIADEYQDVVSTGSGMAIGDDRFCAKSREANAIAIFASQSLTSIKNSVGKEDSAKELFQNFRTMIAGHSTDLMTIHSFQELMGKEEKKRTSHSISENAQKTSRNLILGGFDAKDANISESISTSEQKEYTATGKEFSTLSSFEAFARVYDGNHTTFKKLYMKPFFLKKKNLLHAKVLKLLKATLAIVIATAPLTYSNISHAFPNVCSVVKTSEFASCLGLSVSACMCGFPVPRPCAHFSYYVPQTFIEVFPNPKDSYFGDLPGATIQLKTLAALASVPYGAEADNDTQSFQAHAIAVPFTLIPFSLLPCGVNQVDQTCFESMSEHIGGNWRDGSADSLQPLFLAWSLSPKACLLKGAAESFVGEPGTIGFPAAPGCSYPMSFIPKYAPSPHSACNGWGVFYPRTGVYNGPSQTIGALMIASRMKSLGNELFHTVPASIDEEWQMISPEASSCFKEGQNVGILETVKGAREEQRLINRKLSGYLFTVWSKVSCCRDLAEIPTAMAALTGMSLACQGLGAL